MLGLLLALAPITTPPVVITHPPVTFDGPRAEAMMSASESRAMNALSSYMSLEWDVQWCSPRQHRKIYEPLSGRFDHAYGILLRHYQHDGFDPNEGRYWSGCTGPFNWKRVEADVEARLRSVEAEAAGVILDDTDSDVRQVPKGHAVYDPIEPRLLYIPTAHGVQSVPISTGSRPAQTDVSLGPSTKVSTWSQPFQREWLLKTDLRFDRCRTAVVKGRRIMDDGEPVQNEYAQVSLSDVRACMSYDHDRMADRALVTISHCNFSVLRALQDEAKTAHPSVEFSEFATSTKYARYRCRANMTWLSDADRFDPPSKALISDELVRRQLNVEVSRYPPARAYLKVLCETNPIRLSHNPAGKSADADEARLCAAEGSWRWWRER